ncbi:MAG: hypothetical protein WDM92_12680 [Caulobacteraceae bacterium]
MQHEDLIADLDGSVRRLLDYCGPGLRAGLPGVPQDPAQRAHPQLRAGAPADLPRRPGPVEAVRALARPAEGRPRRRLVRYRD